LLPEVISTPRAVLRPHRSADVDDIFEFAADPEWSRYLYALPSQAYTRADAEGFVALQAQLDWNEHPSWVIEVQGRAAGGINLRFVHEHKVGELGYGLARRLWGRGLVVEVARGVIQGAFDAYPQLARVRARTDGRNAGSLRVMEKLGMQREAVLRQDRFFRGELVDEIICGLLRDEWQR